MNPALIDGLIPEATGELLRRLAREVPVGQCIVEIGAFKGRSTCFLASGASPEVNIISIDPHGLPGAEVGRNSRYVSVRDEYLDNISAFPNVHPIRALSHDAPRPKWPIGLLWVDGDHRYEVARGDYDRFGPLVAVGGHIVIDDFNWKNRGVQRLVGQLMNDHQWNDWRFEPVPLAWARRVR